MIRSNASLQNTSTTVPSFRAAWWLRSPHLQTLWPVFARRKAPLALRRERWELSDGDFLDVDWTGSGEGPIVAVLHGLEGSVESHYARGMMAAICSRGWRGALMHFRGCSGEPNRMARSYHSGETGDLDAFVAKIRSEHPGTKLAVVGYSLGGNVLLKWLGEAAQARPVDCAVAVSVPFELAKTADRLERGFSRVYHWWLMRSLRASAVQKARLGRIHYDLDELSRLRTFRAYDDRVTAPLHGFAGVDDYYARSSSRQYLTGIATPTLIVHALDDPFMTPDAAPGQDELSPNVEFDLTHRGGHVGFVSGAFPWRPKYWLEERIPEYLAGHLGET